MICHRVSEILGLTCHPLSDDGGVAMLDSPFVYPDGDDIPIFIEKIGPQMRFFDDGEAILHLLGRGVSLDDHRKTRFIKNVAEPNGVSLNTQGELEIWSTETQAPQAFAKYMATMLALSKWESDQNEVATDLSLLLEEVALCLRAWKPRATIAEGPEFTGVSGHVYKLDFSLDQDAVIAITPHHASVSSAAKKLLDIRAVSSYAGLKIIVVIDDRHDAANAKREGRILDSVGNVMMMSALQHQARLAGGTGH
jgi:hypothetical protein